MSAKLRDLLALMGASLSVPGFAAYCEKYVEKNQKLVSAAANWNQRHWKITEFVVNEIKREGGLSAEERKQIDIEAYKVVSKEVQASSDKNRFCRGLADLIESGQLDLDRRSDTSPIVARLGAPKVAQ